MPGTLFSGTGGTYCSGIAGTLYSGRGGTLCSGVLTWSHTDFVIYRKIDKSPVLVIEVDGYAFHRKGTRQAERDVLKDAVLAKCGLPLLRLSTVGSNERKRIMNKLDKAVV